MTNNAFYTLRVISNVKAVSRAVLPVGALFAAVVVSTTTAITQTSNPTQTQQAPTTIQGGSGESLSSKLTKSGGVIAPKSDVDPGIGTSAPDPQPSAMPVIPPSATGGDTAK